jgi:hypothetical protein
LVEVPVIEGESSIYGGSIRWDWTDDPRIHQYEVQVDDVNSFPTPTTYTVLEPFFGLENVATTKYLRARAVRFNGQTGNWSNTYKMSPTTSAPECFSKLFYQGYDDSVQQPPLETKVQFSGEPAPKFYVLFEHDFYAKMGYPFQLPRQRPLQPRHRRPSHLLRPRRLLRSLRSMDAGVG